MNFIKKLLKDDEDDIYAGNSDFGKFDATEDAGKTADSPDEIIDDIPPASDVVRARRSALRVAAQRYHCAS